MIKYYEGDVISAFVASTDAVLIHGCNCFNIMGAGIAAQIATRWPDARRADAAWSHSGDRKKLGNHNIVLLDAGDRNLVLVNMYTQFLPGANFEYLAFAVGLDRLYTKVIGPRGIKTIYMPKIGCGIGGGDWTVVKEILADFVSKHKHIEVKVFTLP